jgi:hypothetical protein
MAAEKEERMSKDAPPTAGVNQSFAHAGGPWHRRRKRIGCLYCGAGSEGGAIPEVES